jgi:hypothetical protein
MRGFMRSVWLLNPTTPSAGAGAAAQLPTQCLSLGKTVLHSSALWSNPAAVVASTAMDFEAFMARDRQFASERRRLLRADRRRRLGTMHFPSPSVGHIKRWGDGFRLEYAKG